MKNILCVFTFLVTSLVYGGGSEVPWPEDSLRDVYVRDLQGSWVSKNLDNPQRLFTIKLEVANESITCPYIISINEINPFNGKVMASDTDVSCSSFPRKLIFVLTDEFGQARRQVEIVGLKKPKNDEHLGYQFLGITVYNYGQLEEKLYQDFFYKYSL